MKKYVIIRYFRNKPPKIIKTGLTLKEAQAHCRDPKTRSSTWFDGYTKSA